MKVPLEKACTERRNFVSGADQREVVVELDPYGLPAGRLNATGGKQMYEKAIKRIQRNTRLGEYAIGSCGQSRNDAECLL